MNKLQVALLDKTDVALDFYLEDTSTVQIRSDIEDIALENVAHEPIRAAIAALQALLGGGEK